MINCLCSLHASTIIVNMSQVVSFVSKNTNTRHIHTGRVENNYAVNCFYILLSKILNICLVTGREITILAGIMVSHINRRA